MKIYINLSKKHKLIIMAYILALLPIAISLIEHPLLHGLYGIIALIGAVTATLSACCAIKIDRDEYYSNLTIEDILE